MVSSEKGVDGMAMLEIKDIHKTFYTYDDKPRFHIGPFPRGTARRVRSALHVLNGVALSVEKGDVVAILGPSGSGKTTLLRCLNFLETADSGTLVFDGESFDLGRISRADIARLRKKTAFVFQNYNLFRNKTALQNVTEGLIVARKLPKEQADTIGMKMLAKVGLADRADYYPRQLSGGQQQRVAIARALAADPEVEAIYIATPNTLHYENCKLCLEQGKHVLCEKPLALLGEDLNAIVAASRASDKKLMVGQICRFTPGFAKAKELIDAGELGDIYYVESEYAHDYQDILSENLSLIHI